MNVQEIAEIQFIADQFKEENAIAVGAEFDVSIDGLGDLEINRQWSDQTRKNDLTIAELETFIRHFTDVKNYNADPEKQVRYVDDPMVNGQVRKGRFRQVTTRVEYKSEGDLVTSIQKLRLGFVTSVAGGSWG